MPNCLKCDKPLKSIGTARKNGKSHPDWATREYHKCCYKLIKERDIGNHGSLFKGNSDFRDVIRNLIQGNLIN
jgi:hypothetical protein